MKIAMARVEVSKEKHFKPRQFKLEMGVFEKAMLDAALKESDGNKAQAARILGLSREGIYIKLAKHGVANDNEETPNKDVINVSSRA